MSRRPPRAVVFAPACFPRTQPEAHVNANLVLALHDAGWDVQVVTDPAGGSWYPGADLDVGALEGRVHAVRVRRDPLRRGAAVAAGGVRARVLAGGHSWAYPAFRRAMALHRAGPRPFDLALSRVLPAAAHLAGLLFHEATGVPWIANWNDPEPFDVKSPPPYGGGADAPLPRGHAAFLARVGAAASWHTFPCERLRRWVRGYVPQIGEDRSSVIPHIARDATVHARSSPSDRLSLVMAGSLRPPRSPRALLEGVARFAAAESEPRLRLTLITDHHDDVRAAMPPGVERFVELRPARSYDAAFAALADAHVGVILEADMAEGVYLPSKVVDYTQWALPILAVSPPRGTLADLLREHGGGELADVRDPAHVAAAIARLHDAWRHGTLQQTYGSERLGAIFARERVLPLHVALADRLREEADRAAAAGTRLGTRR